VLGAAVKRHIRYVPALLCVVAAVSFLSRATIGGAALGQPFGYVRTATHLRLEGLAFGVLAAYLAATRPHFFALFARLRWWAIAAAVLALAILPHVPEELLYVLGFSILALVFALVVSVAATDKSWRVAQWRVTKLLALTSYSIYLTHANVIQAVLLLRLPTVATWSLMILASVSVGDVFYRAVEKPAITVRDRLIPRRRLAARQEEERKGQIPSGDIDAAGALS